MKQIVWHHMLILCVSGVVLFTNLGGARLWDRDEPRNAGCAVEMLARGDWVVPYFNGQLRDAKPVLLYWFIMSAYWFFGVNEFAARFWSAAFGIGTVLLTYHMGRRLLGPHVALWGTVILASSLVFDVVARAATPDSGLIFFTTSALAVFVYMAFPQGKRDGAVTPESNLNRLFHDNHGATMLIYGLMGVAVLAKGPVGFVLPTAVVGMYLLIVRLPTARRVGNESLRTDSRFAGSIEIFKRIGRPFSPLHFLRTCWSMRPLTAITVALAVALPWYLWVGLRTDGIWLERFLLEENVGRAFAPMEGHGGSVLFYPLSILAGFFPWSVFIVATLLAACLHIRRGNSRKAGYLFLMCWVGVYVGLFTLARTKLPNYVAPAYPALALLTGSFLHDWIKGAQPAWILRPRLSFGLVGLVGVLISVVAYYAAGLYLPGDEWLGAVGLILTAGAAVCWYLARSDKRLAAAICFTTTAVVFSTILFSCTCARVSGHQKFDSLLSVIQRQSAQPHMIAYGCLEPSWVFYSGRPIREFRGPPEDAVACLMGHGDTFLITTERHFQKKLAPLLPVGYVPLAEAQYFLKKYRLVVIGGRSTKPFTPVLENKSPTPTRLAASARKGHY